MIRRLLLKITIFVVGLGLLLNGLGCLSDKIAPVNEWYQGAKQDYVNLILHKDKIQALSVGNSHSGSIDFDTLGIEGQFLTRAGADLFEVERHIASVEDSLPALKTVFIALSYYSFSRDNATLDNLKTVRIELYAALPVWKPVNGDEGNLVLGKLHKVSRLMSVVRPDHWHDIFLNERGFSVLFDSPTELNIVSQEQSNPCPYLTPEKQESHAREIAGKNVVSSRAMAASHPGLAEDTFEALGKTIERLRAKGIEVILYTPPYYEAYTSHFMAQGSDITDQMHKVIRSLQEKYQVNYYDFSDDPNLITHPEFFINSDHLNNCGRKVFSEHLLKTLEGTTSSARP